MGFNRGTDVKDALGLGIDMAERAAELQDAIAHNKKMQNVIYDSLRNLRGIGYGEEGDGVMYKLKEDLEALERELIPMKRELDRIRDACSHTSKSGKDLMEYAGSDSHKDYYKCVVCGAHFWD